MHAPPPPKVVLVHPREGQLGVIYLDLHPRPAKYTHHAQFTVRCGCLPKGADAYQLPVVALVCNFSPSGEEGGAVLLRWVGGWVGACMDGACRPACLPAWMVPACLRTCLWPTQ